MPFFYLPCAGAKLLAHATSRPRFWWGVVGFIVPVGLIVLVVSLIRYASPAGTPEDKSRMYAVMAGVVVGLLFWNLFWTLWFAAGRWHLWWPWPGSS